MIFLTAIAAGVLILVLGAPTGPVVRVRSLTAGSNMLRSEAPVLPTDFQQERGRRDERAEVDIAVLLDLLAAALRVGSPIPQALSAVGIAASGRLGAKIRRVAAHLALGSEWESAWNHAEEDSGLRAIKSSLAPAWISGAPVAALLDHAKKRVRAERAANDSEAAKRLGVQLILPVALCYLPAFVVLGLVPVLLALIGQGTTPL